MNKILQFFLNRGSCYIHNVRGLKNTLRSPSQFSDYCWRTHTCGDLNEKHVGLNVTLCGWVQYMRQDRFLVLRDWNGSVQLLLKGINTAMIPLESVIKIKGTVEQRPENNVNTEMETGHIEVAVQELDVLNPCIHLQFPIHEFMHKHEDTRMQYRHLDIRTQRMQKNLRLRSKVISCMREFLTNREFVEVETPTLFRPTPGGAREFIVPSSTNPGLFYSLPQSPQQFKQLLMVGGIDRYFQVARCYRDEGTRPDRQPEFTQLDVEMSFVSAVDVINVTEDMIKHCWPLPISDKKFEQISFSDAINFYGTDKPDLRYGMKLIEVTECFQTTSLCVDENIVNAIVVPCNEAELFSKSKIRKLRKNIQNELKSPLRQDIILRLNNFSLETLDGIDITDSIPNNIVSNLCLKQGDIVWVCWGERTEVKFKMGKIRTFVVEALENLGSTIRSNCEYRFVWVYDFPLFELNEEGLLCCVHHPFTAPHPDDIHLLDKDPTSIRSQAYDLVLNGEEIAGGSIRIIDPKLQKRILEEFLRLDSDQLKHMLGALGAGAPPHGGIAIGLDRLLAVLCGAKSIRDVIAFPKTSTSRDLTCNSPCEVDDDTIEHFHLKRMKPLKSDS